MQYSLGMSFKKVLISCLGIATSVIIFCSATSVSAQHKTLDDLGKTILASLKAQDSLQFFELALPVEGVFSIFEKQFASEMTKEDKANAEVNLKINYPKSISLNYGMTFINLLMKIDINEINLDKATFEQVEVPDAKDIPNMVGVYAALDHETYKHFTFYAYKFMDHWYLINHLVSISETNAFEMRKMMNDIQLDEAEDGFLIMNGAFAIVHENASNLNILSCLEEYPLSFGVKKIHYADKNNPESYVEGAWEYNYFVDSDDKHAGLVSFDYKYTVSDNKILFRYSNFKHSQEDTEFSSIGILPLLPNEKVLATFTTMQYEEILEEILFNMRTGIKSRQRLMNSCLK